MLSGLKKALRGTPSWSKQDEESSFWVDELARYEKWFDGEIPEIYGVPSPSAKDKVKAPTHKDSAILTWLNLHQKPKYLADLQLTSKAFRGLKVLDIGAGPVPSGLAFEDCELYCLDPLYSQYLASGYPLHYYPGVQFMNAYSEAIPIDDAFFDAVISVNAIDHVDNFQTTSQEIKRVLKPNGKVAMHVHYHKATDAEPLELSDEIVERAFGWCKGLHKVQTSTSKTGSVAGEGESYVIWRNF
jgi:SAM-dependent methyltransferase